MTPLPRKPRNNREHRFQAWCDRLIDRIVLPPMFVSGIDHASQSTDNARARMASRGVRFGLPDVFVAQIGHTCMWLELKRGSGLSSHQRGVHVAMERAGQYVAVCHNLREVVRVLRDHGFVLHANADAIADEFEQRCEANERAPKSARATSKPRNRVTAAQVRKFRNATGGRA